MFLKVFINFECLPYSAKNIPVPIPMGTPMRAARLVIMKWPTKACLSPPPSMPGGVGSFKNSWRLMNLKPLSRTSPSIQNSHTSPYMAVSVERVSMTTLITFLFRITLLRCLSSPISFPTSQEGRTSQASVARMTERRVSGRGNTVRRDTRQNPPL